MDLQSGYFSMLGWFRAGGRSPKKTSIQRHVARINEQFAKITPNEDPAPQDGQICPTGCLTPHMTLPRSSR
jgi:hypothetical protein